MSAEPIITPELVHRYLRASVGDSTARGTFERLDAQHRVDDVVKHLGIDPDAWENARSTT